MDALAVGTDSTTSILQPVLDNVQASITGIAGPALLVGATVLGLTVAWKVARKFVK
jgi:hypothetical protein